MVKKFFLFFVILLSLVILFFIYITMIGIETNRFNKFIINKIQSYDKKLNLKLKTVKLNLDLANFEIDINTLDPILIYSNQEIILKKINFNFSIKSFLEKTFAVKEVEIVSKRKKITDLVNIYRNATKSPQLYILSQIINEGEASFKIKAQLDSNGNILPGYEIKGDIKKTKLSLLNKNRFQDINFQFEFYKDQYLIKNLLFNFKNVNFLSKNLMIKKKINIILLKVMCKIKKRI